MYPVTFKRSCGCIFYVLSLICISIAVQCIVIGPVCGGRTAGGRAVSAPYYSQRARSVCVSLSAFYGRTLSDASMLYFADVFL